MDLPGELRNKVYTLLLCSFGPVPDNAKKQRDNFFNDRPPRFEPIILSHKNDTTILRTDSRVHSKAYDVMVKTNRIIRINSPGGLPFQTIIASQDVPFIANGRCAVQFNGHVVGITISSTAPLFEIDGMNFQPGSAIIRAIDLEHFCRKFDEAEAVLPELAKAVAIVIDVAPMLAHERPWYQDGLAASFSEATQKAILKPLRIIRGIKTVEVQGPVAPTIAASLESSMKSDELENPNSILETMKLKKESGAEHYREGRRDAAFSTWIEVIRSIIRMRDRTSWTKLINIGGEPWIDKIADLYCSLGLNTTLAGITLWSPHSRSAFTPLVMRQRQTHFAQFGLEKAEDALKPGYWKEGYTRQCPAVLEAKVMYRKAVCIRLWGEVEESIRALHYIHQALMLVPNDPVVLKEGETILKWGAGA